MFQLQKDNAEVEFENSDPVELENELKNLTYKYNVLMNSLYKLLNDKNNIDLLFSEKDLDEILEKFSVEKVDFAKFYVSYKIWASLYWEFIHYLTYIVNETKDVDNLINFLRHLDIILPCGNCVENYRKHDKEKLLFVPMRNGYNPIVALFHFHNFVNNYAKPGEPEYPFLTLLQKLESIVEDVSTLEY